MHRVVSSLIILTFLNICTHADDHSTYGIVRDKETLLPLAGVQVTSVHSGATQITDSTGRFSIKGSGILSGPKYLNDRGTIHLTAGMRTLDISNAPDLITLSLYRLDGKLLLCHQPSAKHSSVVPSPLRPGAYLIKATTRQGDIISRVIPVSDNQVFNITLSEQLNSPFAKKTSAADTLIFSKELYRLKKVPCDPDTLRDGCTVDLKHSIGDYIFLDTVRTYRLTIGEQDMNTLLDYAVLSPGPGNTNPVFVSAHLGLEDRELDSIGVRFRGDQSLWDCIANGKRKVGIHYPQFGFGNDDVCAKFSFKFSFKKYRDDQRLYGLKKLNLRSMSYDPSKMRERLGFSLFDAMNIVAPRTAYARLYVNDEYWGLFCVVEEIDGRMTKQRFPESGDGNLYEALWPDSVTTDGMILEALETNEEEGNTDDFKKLRDAVVSDSTTASNFSDVAGQFIDIPYFIRYIVADRAILNFDGLVTLYVGTGYRIRHNFAWYHDLPASKFILIPWDLDKTFLYPEPNFWTNNEPTGNNNVPNWNVVNNNYTPVGCYFDPGSLALSHGQGPYYNTQPIDADKLLRTFRNATWDDFVATGRRFLVEVFLQDTIDARLSHWRQQIASAVGEDKTIDSTAWESMVDSLSHTIPLIRTHFEKMLDTLIYRQ